MKVNLNKNIISYLTIIFLNLTFQFTDGFSQEYSIRFRLSQNNLDMQDLKNFENNIFANLKNNGISAKKFGSYPNASGYQIQIARSIDSTSYLGLLGDFCSTGSRIHYEDYSGELLTDQVVSRRSLGIFLELTSKPFHIFSLCLTTKLFYIRSELEINSKIRVYDEKADEKNYFNSNDINIAPSIAFQMKYLHILIRLEFGYEHSIYSNSFDKRGNQKESQFQLYKPINAKWDGLRKGLLIGIYF